MPSEPVRDPIVELLCELQRDWPRRSTVPVFVDLLFKKTPEPQAA
jgi:hypothetical protein